MRNSRLIAPLACSNIVVPVALTALLLTLLPGCTAQPRPGLSHGVVQAWNRVVGGHVHESESFLVPATGVLNVEVDSFAGNIVVQTAAKAETASIDVVRRGTHGLGRTSESEASLKDLTVTYGVEDRAGRATLVVKSTTAHVEPWHQAVDIDIRVPRLGVVVVRTSRGHVMATDFEDGVDIETTGGDVRAATTSAITSPSTILNRGGSIDWRVGPSSAGAFEMEAINGEVQVRVLDGVWLATDRRNDSNSNYGLLNRGAHRVILRTVDGDIRLFVGPNATEMGTFID